MNRDLENISHSHLLFPSLLLNLLLFSFYLDAIPTQDGFDYGKIRMKKVPQITE